MVLAVETIRSPAARHESDGGGVAELVETAVLLYFAVAAALVFVGYILGFLRFYDILRISLKKLDKFLAWDIINRCTNT